MFLAGGDKSGGGQLALLGGGTEGKAARKGRGRVARSTELKVFAGPMELGGQVVRAIIAATSQKQVAKATGNKPRLVSRQWGATTNERQSAIALAQPGQVFYCPSHLYQRADAEWKPVADVLRAKVEEHLRKLNGIGMQNIPDDGVARIAEFFCKASTFFEGFDATYITSIEAVEFQAVMDYMLFLIKNLAGGSAIAFLEHVGRPLSNDEMIRYFFFGTV